MKWTKYVQTVVTEIWLPVSCPTTRDEIIRGFGS